MSRLLNIVTGERVYVLPKMKKWIVTVGSRPIAEFEKQADATGFGRRLAELDPTDEKAVDTLLTSIESVGKLLIKDERLTNG